jgi:hypothetical protein
VAVGQSPPSDLFVFLPKWSEWVTVGCFNTFYSFVEASVAVSLWWLGDRLLIQGSWFYSQQGQDIYLFSKVALGHTHSPLDWVHRGKAAGVWICWLFIPSISRLRMSGAIPSLPNIPSWHAQELLYLLLHIVFKSWCKKVFSFIESKLRKVARSQQCFVS